MPIQIINFLNFFTRSCDMCFGARRLWKPYKIQVQAMDGVVHMKICDECAKTLESIKALKSGKELKEDQLDDTL